MQHELNVLKLIKNKDNPMLYLPLTKCSCYPTHQSSTLDHPRIAHRLYSIITATDKHPEIIMHSKQKL